MNEHWAWRRWQLVKVEHCDDHVLVDAIELATASDAPGGLVTMAIQGQRDAEVDSQVGKRLEAWLDRDDGVCDAFESHDQPVGCLALFQGSDSLIVGAVWPSG